jgi:hypothetical protein
MGGSLAMTCLAALIAAAGLVVSTARATTLEPLTGILGLPEPLSNALTAGPFSVNAHPPTNRPHPAVARIVVPEGNEATSYGSGTLVDVRDQFGLVVTNWHVVRDGTGEVEVIFPDGFRSKARPLKVDSDWDLAALVIWRPPVKPVAIAAVAPQPGDQLTICGYGSGQYRAATGRCTQYYAPKLDLPQHMVELDVEARQGDSGGPIFNDRGELAGVLFGAGQGTTLGSFGGRVGSFLAPLAPDIGKPSDNALVQADAAAPNVDASHLEQVSAPQSTPPILTTANKPNADAMVAAAKPRRPATPAEGHLASMWTEGETRQPASDNGWRAVATTRPNAPPTAAAAASSGSLLPHAKNILAVVGALALALQVLRIVR